MIIKLKTLNVPVLIPPSGVRGLNYKQMKTEVSVKICNDHFILRTVIENDADVLRLWKNRHKEFFFYNKDISYEEQIEWISALSKRANDNMYIIFDDKKPIGCIGARLIDEYVDIYNVILGDKNYKGRHVMKNALWSVVALSSFLYNNRKIKVSVLKNNPAIKWYEKIGFNTTESFEDYIVMEFNDSAIQIQYVFNINITLPTI